MGLNVTVSLDNETVWLTQKQMAELFDVKSQAITRHLKNIYNDEELFKEATCSKMDKFKLKATVKWIFIMQSKNTRDFSREMN